MASRYQIRDNGILTVVTDTRYVRTVYASQSKSEAEAVARRLNRFDGITGGMNSQQVEDQIDLAIQKFGRGN